MADFHDKLAECTPHQMNNLQHLSWLVVQSKLGHWTCLSDFHQQLPVDIIYISSVLRDNTATLHIVKQRH